MDDIAVITDDYGLVNHSQFTEYMKEFNGYFSESRMIIAIVCTNTIGCLIGYLSGIKYGNVPLMLERDILYEELADYICNYGINYVWVPDEWLNKNQGRIFKCRKAKFCHYGYSLFLIKKTKRKINDELAFLLTANDNCADRKLVSISRKNIRTGIQDILKSVQVNKTDRIVTSIPLHTNYALSLINTCFRIGAIFLLTDKRPSEKGFWSFIRNYRGSIFAGEPYIYKIIMKHELLYNNKSLHTYVVKGKMGIVEEEKFIDYANSNKKKLIFSYGTPETMGEISYRRALKRDNYVGSLGKNVFNGEIWLVDDEDKRVISSYQCGEIVFKGENVAMGYAHSVKDFVKGCEFNSTIYTGDIGYIDENESFYLLERGNKNLRLNEHDINLSSLTRKLRNIYVDYKIRCRIYAYSDKIIRRQLGIEVFYEDNIEATDVENIRKKVYLETGVPMKLIKLSINGCSIT